MIFEARQSLRNVAEDLFLKTLGVGLFGFSSWLLGSRPAQELGSAFWPVRALVVLMGAATLGLAAEVVTMAVHVVRRQVIVRVDGDGLTVGPRWFWSRAHSLPWAGVSSVGVRRDVRVPTGQTSGSRTVVDLLEVQCQDGVVRRRRLDRRRYDPGALAAAIRTVSPQTLVTVDGDAVPG